MCKLCDLEHSDRWTCAQARANFEDWQTKVEEKQPVDPVVPRETKPNHSEFMKEWWRKKRAN